MRNPKNGGHSTKYSYYNGDVEGEIGGQGVSASYWALIAKDVLSNSRNKTYSKQEALLQQPYAAPKAIEIATGILMHYVGTGEQLYPNIPGTYTRCQETYSDGYHVLVGGFGCTGLEVGRCTDVTLVNRDDWIGLGAVRRF